ncbi:ABC transporter permease [Pokkaliibacter plantistimulans]|uniref:ABC transporter permease n=1 Tax=Proteobacteria bacterium 228 TaxID=2083153 RepID=A0A2S5KIU9_9PROT|nr:ABC transporter permease [Pokkaliibacter plantistimulans]PPC74708.1 ABC transporter permease [Pokkaliibacter plantistimulans]
MPKVLKVIRSAAFGNLFVFCATLILAGLVLLALTGDLLAPMDPAAQSLRERLLQPGSLGGAGVHLLGTDSIGRDVLSMIIAGARPALFVSIACVAIAAAFGTAVGMLAGYRGGRAANLLLYATNIQLAFPFFIIAVTIVGIARPSVPLVVLVIALGCWVPFARIAYAETIHIMEMEYIEAIRVMRGSVARILLRHVLPNVLPNLLVLATFALGTAIMMESGLSFVGLGLPTDTPTWGRMLSEGRDYMQTSWWLTAFPGAAIFLLVLTINVCGERLRDITDPKQRDR